jgi:hypothetical protein
MEVVNLWHIIPWKKESFPEFGGAQLMGHNATEKGSFPEFEGNWPVGHNAMESGAYPEKGAITLPGTIPWKKKILPKFGGN